MSTFLVIWNKVDKGSGNFPRNSLQELTGTVVASYVANGNQLSKQKLLAKLQQKKSCW